LQTIWEPFLTWLRVGGPADWLVQPADTDDLARFLRQLPRNVPVFPLGVGSNLIVRDGGIEGRRDPPWSRLQRHRGHGDSVIAGAAALDAHVAKRAAAAGRRPDLPAHHPGSLGGALRMNAGCYGTYMAPIISSGPTAVRGRAR
jgi:UDP-N-acetylmuramate dehydrogenase